MAYVTIPSTSIEVGDALKKELFDLIKDNLDDHETRIQTLSGGSGKISVFNDDILIGGNALLTGVVYYEAIQPFNVIEVSIQIFEKPPATTGSLTVDVKKNTDTNDANFTTILTTQPTINIATDPDYTRDTGVINTGAQTLNTGDILRVDITALPTGLQRFRVVVIGEF